MDDLKKGGRVTVKVDDRPAFNGLITGEGRSGHWWMVLKDGTKHPNGYHKNFCRPEAARNASEAADAMAACPYWTGKQSLSGNDQ